MPSPGSIITLASSWVNPDTGAFEDPDSISLSILSGTTVIAGPFTPSDHPSVGQYRYAYAIPNTFQGVYIAQWAAVFSGNTTYVNEQFGVMGTAQTPVTGISVNDVANTTGVAVTQALLNQAISVIEMYASISLADFGGFAAGDRFWLQKAVAYQAAWMSNQVNYMGRTDFANQAQDGLSLTTRDDTDLFLAPLAQKALSRVRWLRPRTIRVLPSRHLEDQRQQHINRATGVPITDYNFDHAESVDMPWTN